MQPLIAEIRELETRAASLRERIADRDTPMSDIHTWQDDLDLCNERLRKLREQLERMGGDTGGAHSR